VVAERPQRSRLIIGYAGISVLFVTLVRRPIAVGNRFDAGIVHAVRIAALEIWGLFIDNGSVALVAIAVLLAVTVFTERVTGQPGLAALLLSHRDCRISWSRSDSCPKAEPRHRALRECRKGSC
jgi:hypothetical protein